MTRVFAACGWPCDIIGERTDEKDGHLVACLWEVNETLSDKLAKRGRIDKGLYDLQIYRRPAPQRSDIAVTDIPEGFQTPPNMPSQRWIQENAIAR